jgi:hypothetical protein
VAAIACGLGSSGAQGQSAGTVDSFIANCPSAADIAAISADQSLSFEADPTAGTLVCTAAAGSANLTRAQERAYIQLQNLAALTTQRWIDERSGAGLSGLMTVIAHEARHSEIGGHTCGAKDATYRELGAWGIQHDLKIWLALYTGSFLDAPARTSAITDC